MSVLIRQLKDTDTNFIFSSYLKSLRPHRSNITNKTFFSAEHKRMEFCLANGITAVMVDVEDDSHIVGWCNGRVTPEKLIFNYVYIKHTYRGNGFAKQLIQGFIDAVGHGREIEYTIHVAAGINLIKRYNMIFDPYYFDFSQGANNV